MAAGDVLFFHEAKAYMLDGGWEAADSMEINLIRAVSTPAQTDAAPDPADYTLATSTEGAQVLDTWGNMVTQSTGTVTIDDTGATVVWAAGGGNSTDCRWALVYNQTTTVPHTDAALCYIDLGSNLDLSTGSITITWNASGIATISA